MSQPHPMPTLENVALEAGVSRQTVSNVLRHPERVHPDTRARVLAVVDAMGYRPSQAARQLATRQSMGLAVPAHRPQPEGISGLLLDAFLHSLCEAGKGSGHRVILFPGADDVDDEIDMLEDLLLTGTAGAVILTAVEIDDRRAAWLGQRRAAFCTFGRPWRRLPRTPPGPPPHDWVDIDGAAGCREAVRHLAGLGARRLAFVGWPAGSGVGDDRRSGYRAGIAELALADVPVRPCHDEAGAALAATAEALTRTDPPEGIVCASDTLALGAWRAIGDRGIPVVGFDSTPVTAVLGLPSVAQPTAEAARTCLDLVRARLADPALPCRGVLLRPTLSIPAAS